MFELHLIQKFRGRTRSRADLHRRQAYARQPGHPIVNGGTNMPAFGARFNRGNSMTMVAFLETRKRLIRPQDQAT